MGVEYNNNTIKSIFLMAQIIGTAGKKKNNKGVVNWEFHLHISMSKWTKVYWFYNVFKASFISFKGQIMPSKRSKQFLSVHSRTNGKTVNMIIKLKILKN